MIRTISQTDLETAARRVDQIKSESWYKTYGRLCHSFPALVRAAGLCQALAFHQSKAAGDGDRAEAHKRLLADARELLGDFDPGAAGLSEYMWATRRVLAAWIFYKRFAVSILGVKSADTTDEEGNGG